MNKILPKILLVCLMTLLVLTGCHQTSTLLIPPPPVPKVESTVQPSQTITYQAQDKSYTFKYPNDWYDLKDSCITPLSLNPPPELIIGKIQSNNSTNGICLEVYRLVPPYFPDIEGTRKMLTEYPGVTQITESSLNDNEFLYSENTYNGLTAGIIYVTTIGDCYLLKLSTIGNYQEFDSIWDLLKRSLVIVPSKHYARYGGKTAADENRRWIDLKTNPNAANPTWQELLDFLRTCQVDQIPFNPPSFSCADYAEALYNDSEAAGIRTAFVAVHFYDSSIGHSLNAYQTTDRGLVFIDATQTTTFQSEYKIVDLKVGKAYLPRGPLPGEQRIYMNWEKYGKVKDFFVIW